MDAIIRKNDPRELAYSQVIQKFPKVTQPIVKLHIGDKKVDMCCKSTEGATGVQKIHPSCITCTRALAPNSRQHNVDRYQDDPLEPHDK